ncbi:L-ascorbate oxidase-like [Pecten maximus]|uniref:L-ascorbate oxidase-like n=1 Tax=Pecten maximus TaxID=6579 RepID=UPI0014587593|nr:L-ascorbate oxidase-like [Pecten maximus]
MFPPFYLIWLVVTVSGADFEKEVIPSCGPEVEVCEFYWTIDYKETMVYYANEGYDGEPVVLINDTLFRRNTCSTLERLTDEELKNVTTADGRYKLVYAINEQVPGPPVVVYRGQQVIVHVKNKLESDGVTIHWHGLTQKGSPWMDGTGSISQCPIAPEATFVYRFMAEDVGTSLYHAHHGMMRTDGIAGPLIVLLRDSERAVNAVDDVDRDYTMFLQDWFIRSGPDINSYLAGHLSSYIHGLDQEGCSITPKSLDGEITADIPFESALINGKGRYNHTQSIDGLPYETFTVTSSGVYRFRIISNAMVYAFRVSVDQHTMTVISTDGSDVEGFEAESVVIHSGERYDVIIRADQAPGSYWIRTETMDKPAEGEASSPNFGLAVLRYQDTELVLPTSQKNVCDKNNPCKVVNCPFLFHPDYYIECTSLADLKTTNEEQAIHPVPVSYSTETFQEIFLNFVYAWSRLPITAAINNKGFVRPSVPLQTYPDGNETFTACVERCDEYCTCTQVVKLDIGNTVQLVLLNINDSPFGMSHPIHIHAHRPHVIKMVYPEYDGRGRISNRTQDIRCDTSSCNSATWSNSSWNFGNVPGVNLDNPPRKDTVIIPRQGYVVLRMVADNPGYWFLHCHIEVHQIAGMSLVLQEGEITDMPPLPKGFPVCGNFRPDPATQTTDNTSRTTVLGAVPSASATDNGCATWNKPYMVSTRNQRVGYVVLISILAVSNLATLIVTCVVIHRRIKMKYVLNVPYLKRPTDPNDKPEPEVFFSSSEELSGSKEKLVLM